MSYKKHTIPIRDCDINDIHARYKMPQLVVKSKNNGQYNKTTIDNIKNVAKALHINPKYLHRHFASMLNTQMQLHENILQLKGTFDYDKILECLRVFIRKYVLCEVCNYPELVFGATKKSLKIKCQACGFTATPKLTDKMWKLVHKTELCTPSKSVKIARPRKEETFEFAEVQVDDDWGMDVTESAIEERKASEGNSKLMENLLQ